jgi:5-methylcytosine-specific restriction endonuclease McrA
MDLHERSDRELLCDVATLVGSHRELTAKLVAHLAEIEERGLELLSGYSSMFDFCQKKLGMSEAEAFRRILAARLSRRFPLVLPLLASGSVTLSTLELVRHRLTEENHEELLAEVVHKRKREVQSYLASRFPRADEPWSIRPLASVEPLSEGRFKVEFTASESLCDKLELCRDLMSHANPSRDLGVVVERAMDLLVAELDKKRLGKTKRSRQAVSARERRRITNDTRRRVFERDGALCTYVAEDGRRCEARAFLELDHIDPKARGGTNDAANLRVRCRAHNLLWAEQAFGREQIENFRQKMSAARARARSEAAWITSPVRSNEVGKATNFEKVRWALRNLGFHDGVARRAVAVVAERHDSREFLDLERALREALLAATAAA